MKFIRKTKYIFALPGLIFLLHGKSYAGPDHTITRIISVPPQGSLLELDEVGISGFRLGYGQLLTDLKIEEAYDDNITFQEDRQTSAYITTISPHASYIITGRHKKFVLDYVHETAIYVGSSEDNYHDNRLRASFGYEPTRKLSMEAHTEFIDSHDRRGEGRAEGGAGIVQTSLDEWHQYGMEGRLAYGRHSARGRIEVEAGYRSKRYDTNRQFTFTRDRDDLYGAARFFYRVGPKTRTILEARRIDFDYARDAPGQPSLDGATTRYLLGIDWQRTYKTSGYFKLGYVDKTFDEAGREDDAGFTWEMGTIWKPKSYSTVHFSTTQDLSETNGTGDAVDVTISRLNWTHFWKQRLSSTLNAFYGVDEFVSASREDKIYGIGLRLNYDMRRWLNLSTGYQYTERQSDFNNFDFEQNVIDLSAIVSF